MNTMKIERTSKQVIENKLLAALDDATKVAALFDQQDCDVLIWGLEIAQRYTSGEMGGRMKSLGEDLVKLRTAAFGEDCRCAHCRKPATCFGAYEGNEPGYACDDCCGHGNEDGNCHPLNANLTGHARH